MDWVALCIAAVLIGALALLGVVLGGAVIWRHHREADPLANVGPAAYQPAQSSGGETVPVPAAPKRP